LFRQVAGRRHGRDLRRFEHGSWVHAVTGAERAGYDPYRASAGGEGEMD
jgi:hypothetical protein